MRDNVCVPIYVSPEYVLLSPFSVKLDETVIVYPSGVKEQPLKKRRWLASAYKIMGPTNHISAPFIINVEFSLVQCRIINVEFSLVLTNKQSQKNKPALTALLVALVFALSYSYFRR